MKKVLVTIKLLKSNEDRISKLWNAKLNTNNEIYSQNKLTELSKNCDGILCSILDKIDERTISKFSNSVKIISNFAVGYGNIGCITQIANGTKIPILHTAEIIDWYTGGPKPKVLENL